MNYFTKLSFFITLFIPLITSAQTITTIVGTGSSIYSGDGGPATAAGCTPFDLRLDGAGNIVFSDRLNQRIRKVNTAGIITTFAGTGAVGYSGDGGPATAAQLNVLNGVSFDLTGNFLIADGPNNRIRKVNLSNIISTIAGNGSWGGSGDGGPATLAEIADAYGVTVDYSGNIYIADSYNNRIRKIDLAGTITTVAGNGSVGFSGDGGPATNAQLSWPTGVVADRAGNLYLCDDENNRIRKVNTSGIITTIAGSGRVGVVPGAFTGSYTGDGGPATAATLNTPVYLTLDDCGNIFFPDYGNNCVRKISSSGIITTIAGTGVGGFSGDGGPATAAHMYRPTGIAIDATGNILFADQGNNRIRKITTTVAHTTTSRDTTVCAGKPVTLYADSSGPHLWSNTDTTASITVTTSGTYWVTTTLSGCGFVTDTTHVIYAGALPVGLGNDTAICNGSSITLAPTVPAGSSLTWSTGATGPSITVNTAGTYWVSISDSGCSGSDTIQIAVKPLPVVNLGPDISVCQGVPVTLQSSGTYSSPAYLWSTGSTSASISPTVSGNYWLSITVAGCTGSDTVAVNFKPDPSVNLGNDTVICPQSTITLGSHEPAGVQYLWSTGSIDSSISITAAGTYSLTVTMNGCSASASVTVSEGMNASVNLGADTTLCVGTYLVLRSNSNASVWSNNYEGSEITVYSSGTYWVMLKGQCGTASDTIHVGFQACDLVFPSAFTPNGDGRNDFIGVEGDCRYCTGFSLSIYNRWGQRVFYTTDMHAGWDGTFNGIKQDIGTYFYLIYYTAPDKQHMMKGDFQLIR